MATSAKNQTTATTARYRDFGDTVLVQTPAAATNLSATAANNAVALAWNDNATTETGYRVERRAGSGAWASVATLAANAVSYTDASIAAGTTYSYRVIATAAVNGAPSNEATVTTPGGTSSNTTLGTTADGFTKGGTSAGAVFGGSTIEVKHDTNAAFLRFGYVKFDVSGVDGASLTNIKLRLFGGSSQTASTIIPVNVFGAGSAWSESTLTHNTRPANTSGTLGTLSVGPGAQWYEVDVTNHVKAQIAAGATSITFALQGTTTTSPFARFNSRESGSNGPELALTRTVTATPQPPAAASAASATASSQTSVTVTWTDNSTNETGFIVQRRVGAGTWQQVATTTAGATSYTDTSVTAATSYGYRIIATNAVGPAAASNEALVTTPANPVSSTRTLNTTADAYVQDGTSASTNFGTTSGLVVKKGSTGFNRQGYTKFDLSSLTNVNSAKLRVFVTMNVADSMQLAVHSISNDSWTESGLTWNNRPAAGTALATAQVSNKDGAWIEIDLSAHVKAAVAAGQKTLSLNLQSTANSTAFATIASRESGNGAQLVVA
jgi:hypothetical protein